MPRVQWSFEYLQGCRFQNFSWQLSSVSESLGGFFFSPFFSLLCGWLFPCSHLGLLPLVLLLYISMKGLPLHCTVGATRSPLSFLFSRLNIHNCLSLSSYIKCFSTSDHLGVLPWAHPSVSMSLVLGSPDTHTALQILTLRCQMEGVTSLHHSCFSSPGCCWPPLPQGRIAYSCSTRCPPTPMSSAELLSSLGAQVTLLREALYEKRDCCSF